MLCHVMLHRVVLCRLMLFHVMLCHVILRHVVLRHVMLSHVMICHNASPVVVHQGPPELHPLASLRLAFLLAFRYHSVKY